MRSIVSKKESNRTNQIILGIFLVFVMVASVLGYAFLGEEKAQSREKVSYNGWNFLKQNGRWALDAEGANLNFKYNPNEIERISGIINPLSNYAEKPLYISYENGEAMSEIYPNLYYFV